MSLKRSGKMILTVQVQCTCGWLSSPKQGKNARPEATTEYLLHECLSEAKEDNK